MVTASINHVAINYTVQDADTTLDLVATGLANTINASPNLVDVITANASGAEITISADAAGVPFTLETNTTNNGNDDSQASTAAVVTANATRYQLQSSGSITFTDLDLTDTSNVTRSFVSASGADLSDALSTALQNLESAFCLLYTSPSPRD